MSVNGQNKVSDIFNGTLTSYGLSHLPDEDKVRIRTLLDDMNATATKIYREKAELYDSSIEYWRNQGYEPESISFLRRDGRWLLVVGTTFLMYTTDYPPTFPIDTLANGRYLVRKDRGGGGISELIAKGKVEDLRFAKWQSLRR